MKISDLIGVPFKDRGRDLTGMDCYGLVKEIYHRLGIELPNLYIDCFDIAQVNGEYQLQSKHLIPLEKPEQYCIIAFRSQGLEVDHFGIYLDKGIFIHACSSIGYVAKTQIDHPFWKHRIEGYYFWKD